MVLNTDQCKYLILSGMAAFLEQIKEAFSKLDALLPSVNFSYEVDDFFSDQSKAFYKNLNDFYFPRLKNCKLHQNQKFFRITKKYGELKEEKVSEFYNPPPCYTKYGRCNYHFYPVFYLSSNPIAAFIETVKKEHIEKRGTYYYLSEWSCQDNVTLNATIFLEESLKDNHPWKQLEERYFKEVKSTFQFLSSDQISELLRFVAGRFLIDNDYRYASFLSHDLLYGEPHGADYIVYPSVKEDRVSMNFAFRPQLLLNNSFIFEKVHKIIVYDFEFNNPELKARWEVESSFTSVDGLMLLKSKEIDRGFFEQHFNIG